MTDEDEVLDEEGAIELLNAALALQYRSALQSTLASRPATRQAGTRLTTEST